MKFQLISRLKFFVDIWNAIISKFKSAANILKARPQLDPHTYKQEYAAFEHGHSVDLMVAGNVKTPDFSPFDPSGYLTAIKA